MKQLDIVTIILYLEVSRQKYNILGPRNIDVFFQTTDRAIPRVSNERAPCNDKQLTAIDEEPNGG